MTLRPPAHKELESAIEARLAAGEVLSPDHADHVQGCVSCAQLFDDLAALAERTPLAPADLKYIVWIKHLRFSIPNKTS